jgi:formate hydrogenlyase subunit 6/NADH:ubiquinone oxidoreductase subunit I
MKYLNTIAEKCNGCNACMSACSQLYFKEDNPEKSAIRVTRTASGSFVLSVCNQCQRCVAECPTQAITVNKHQLPGLRRRLPHVDHDDLPERPGPLQVHRLRRLRQAMPDRRPEDRDKGGVSHERP